MAMCLEFIGPPGAGKGTQAARVCADRDIVHLSTGDMIRDHIRRGTDLGAEANAIVNDGALLPDSLVSRMVGERLSHDDCVNGFLLDGYPRTVEQVGDLDVILSRAGWQITAVLFLDVPEDELVRRIAGRRTCEACNEVTNVSLSGAQTRCPTCSGPLSQREDDREEVVRERLRVYREQTAPVLRTYEGRHLLERVDGNGSMNVVADRIDAVLDKVAA
ncbi:MAG: adenylate kinase [Acidobacteriota bacterium]